MLQRKDILLAAAGIEQDSQGQRLVGLGGEILDLLRHLVFEDVEVILGEMRDQRAMLVVHGEVKAHQVDVYFEGLERLLLVVLIGVSRRSLGWGVGRRRNLGHGRDSGSAQQGAQQDRPAGRRKTEFMEVRRWNMANDTSENGTGLPYNATGVSGNLICLIVSHSE